MLPEKIGWQAEAMWNIYWKLQMWNIHKQTQHSYSKLSYLWIAEPEVQTSKVGEKAEASEENPVLELKTEERGKKVKQKNN